MLRRLRNTIRPDALSSDIDREFEFHIAEKIDELMSKGVSASEARRIAYAQFGNRDAWRDQTRDRNVAEWLDTLVDDARFGLRSLKRNPGFACVALLSLACGIGASAAIFSVVDAALLRPLPYASANELVHIWEVGPDRSSRSEASYPDYLDWRAGARGFAGLEGYDPTNIALSVDNGAAMIRGARVTAGFFDLLGARAQLGKLPNAGDGSRASEERVAVLSDELWRREYGAKSSVIGRDVSVSGASYRIVGILPRGFRFAPAGDAEIWLPLEATADRRADRGNYWVNVIGRMRSDTHLEAVSQQLAAVMQGLADAHPETNTGRSTIVVPMRDEIAGDVRGAFVALSVAVALLLTIACANVAGLLLSRGFARAQEMAVRSALGAGRRRLLRQLITEAAVLAAIGGVIGIAAGHFAIASALRAIPDSVLDRMPYLRDVHLDIRVIVFSIIATGIATIAAGLVPALAAANGTGRASLRIGSRIAAGGHHLRDALVCAEIAVTVMLLVGAGLMARSVTVLLRSDTGFAADEVLTGRVALSGPAYRSDAAQRQFFERLVKDIRAIPGVRAAGAITNLPLDAGGNRRFHVQGMAEPGTSHPEAAMRGVAGDYFAVMQIPVLSGRVMEPHDDSSRAKVAVINRRLEERFFGRASAIGSLLRFDDLSDEPWKIIGVVADVHTDGLDHDVPPTVYYSHLQLAENRMSLTVSTSRPREVSAAIRDVIRASDPAVPFYSARTMSSVIDNSEAVFARRYPLLGLRIFSTSALGLAMIGLFGLMSFSVRQRRREFGIRSALGASRIQIALPVLKHAARLGLAGFALGIIGSFVLSGTLRSLLYGVSPTDPRTLLSVGATMLITIAAGVVLPMRYVLRVPPSDVLRAD